MNFGSNPELEARIGRVCLVFARVEQEAGSVVQAAHGNFDAAGTREYLEYSAISGVLADWLKEVGKVYPEVAGETGALRSGLKSLKAERDEWAHSAAVIDAYLLMVEQGVTSMDFPNANSHKLLNARKAMHTDPPSDSDVDEFCSRASDLGDVAMALGLRLAELVDDKGVRPVRNPKDKAV